MAKCLRRFVPPTELEDWAHAPRVHVYGPVRLVSGAVDAWWSSYRANAGAAAATGAHCCAPDTIRLVEIYCVEDF